MRLALAAGGGFVLGFITVLAIGEWIARRRSRHADRWISQMRSDEQLRKRAWS